MRSSGHPRTRSRGGLYMSVVMAVLLGGANVHAFATAPLAIDCASRRIARGLVHRLTMQKAHVQPVLRRSLILQGASLLGSAVVGAHVASAAGDTQDQDKPLFRKVPRIQFIAALGDPAASSGIGADKWGLWVEDPGPRGVYLDRFAKLQRNGGKAPAGWKYDSADWWLEEHGLIMEQPSVLPTKKYDRQTKTTLPRAKYVVSGDREVTTVLTVHTDGRWELDKGTLYDVTHLPCRSARYTPAGASAACSPPQANRKDFPVKPGAAMPAVSGCDKQDYAVLFVLGVER